MILSHAGILRRARKKSFLPVCVKKSANQFWLVYCRENARKSRLGNQRGKKCPNFANIYNSLTVRLLSQNMAIMHAKHKC